MISAYSPDRPLPVHEPDFENVLKVLRCETPDRPTLFEFFMNAPLYQRLVKHLDQPLPENHPEWLLTLRGFQAAGYDYATLGVPGFGFASDRAQEEETFSLNAGAAISDRASFDAYEWMDPADARYSMLDSFAEHLPRGMKLIMFGPDGILENVIKLIGYENLCFMIVEDEQLVYDVFENVGSRLVEYYRRGAKHPVVGACIDNDDWGFNTQTMLSPADMRRFVLPWHKKLVEAVHEAGKPVILHSCGYYGEVIDEVIDDLKLDGRHSYEDKITPVEQAYEELHGRIAVLGGIDVDFMCRHTPAEVNERAKRMLERTAGRGGYALGSGNSIPEYVPDEAYIAMIRAALDAG